MFKFHNLIAKTYYCNENINNHKQTSETIENLNYDHYHIISMKPNFDGYILKSFLSKSQLLM